MAESKILAGEHEEARSICQTVSATAPQEQRAVALTTLAWSLFLEGEKEQALQLLQQAIVLNPSSSRAHQRLGIVTWKSQTTLSVASFLQAAKLDPNEPTPFVYLGHYYTSTGQEERGKRCYQKALALDPLCEDAGSHLHDIFMKAKDAAGAKALLQRACAAGGPGRSAWAWLRIGAMQLKDEEFLDAVVSLQNALKGSQSVNPFRVKSNQS